MIQNWNDHELQERLRSLKERLLEAIDNDEPVTAIYAEADDIAREIDRRTRLKSEHIGIRQELFRKKDTA